MELTFRALADPRRRQVLSCLLRHRTTTLPDLAECVAETERDERIAEIPPEDVRDIYLSLYHTHIPLLEDGGLVRYEQEADCVTTTESTVSAIEHVHTSVDSLLVDC